MRSIIVAAVFSIWLVPTVQAADSARPGAPHLFPHDVLAYARINDMTELKQTVKEGQFGKLLNDPELKPLAGDLYAGTADLFQQVGERLGVSLDELLSIPEGEVAVGLLAFDADDRQDTTADAPQGDSPAALRERIERRRRRNGRIGMIGIMEAGDRNGLLKRLLDRLSDRLLNQGYAVRDSEAFDTPITAFQSPGVGQPGIEFCQLEGVTIFGVGDGVVEETLARWKGTDKTKSLAQNQDFGAVMGPCVGAEATEPQITFFVNPYAIGERLIKARGGAAALVWPLIEDLGIDKLKGIGGSSFSGGETFDGILHVHVLVQAPRDGLFSVVRPASGDINPPKWVPDDISSYTTLYWDLPNSYKGLGRIVDRFQGEDTLERRVEEPLQREFGIDVQGDLLELLTGRVTLARWYEPPARINSQSQLFGIEVKDAAKAAELLAKLADRFPEQMNRQDEGNVVVYAGRQPPADRFPENLRRPEPRLALLGDQILFTDSSSFLQRAIRAHGGAQPRLTGVPEYDLVAGEVGGKLDGQPPFLFSFSRAQEMLRQFYEMAAAPEMKASLARQAENNPGMARLSEIMNKHDLPPFDVLSKYFAPGGSFAYDSPTGIHYTTFNLRPMP